jgi:hypothetical protein
MTETEPEDAQYHEVFSHEVCWHRSDEAVYPYSATLKGKKLLIRVNEFPVEPYMYTLFFDGKRLCDFNGWPDSWKRG